MKTKHLDKIAVKRAEAKARQERYNSLSIEAKLEQIAVRPGESKKETERLLKQLK